MQTELLNTEVIEESPLATVTVTDEQFNLASMVLTRAKTGAPITSAVTALQDELRSRMSVDGVTQDEITDKMLDGVAKTKAAKIKKEVAKLFILLARELRK